MRLSVLICSLEKRAEQLERLLKVLRPQLNTDVEVQVNIDDGQKTIGQKRNELLNIAKGDYVCYVDDDDLVSDDYVSKILNAVQASVDCCGITGEITFTNGVKRLFKHSIENEWVLSDNIYYRYPNHINPLRRELVSKVGFPEKDFGEDKDFADRIRPLLKTEMKIPGIIYYYLASYTS